MLRGVLAAIAVLCAGIRAALANDEALDEIERRVRKVLAACRKAKPDNRARIADLKGQLENLVNAIATRGMRSSPSIGRRLAEVEDELARLETVRPESTVVPLVTDIRDRAKGIIKRLPVLPESDPEKARAALRDAGLGPQIVLRLSRRKTLVPCATEDGGTSRGHSLSLILMGNYRSRFLNNDNSTQGTS
jgi:hypothetical protein